MSSKESSTVFPASRLQSVARLERLQLDRPLPSHLEAERSILGAILLDNAALNVALETVRPEDFFHDHHLHILRQMVLLQESGVPIDLVTLTNELQRVGKLEAAGGAAYVSQLMDGVPHITNVGHYARIVKEKSVLRGVIHAANAIQQQALEAEDDADTVVDRAFEAIGNLRESSTISRPRFLLTAREIAAELPEPVEWVAYPIAARGMVVCVDGPAKSSGKTTMLLTAANAVLSEHTFLNQATRRGPILYVTEEGRRTFRLALERAGLGDRDDLHVLYARNAGLAWPELARLIERKARELGVVWLIVDTFYAVAGLGGEAENKAGEVDEALVPILQIASSLDIPVTLTRHTRKSGGPVGEAGRGSVAFTGAMDIVCQLGRAPGNWPGLRQLETTGRIDGELKLEIELVDGIYRAVSPDGADEATAEVEQIRQVIAATPGISKRRIVSACGLRWDRVGDLLAAHEGRLWRKEPGARNAVLYFPV